MDFDADRKRVVGSRKVLAREEAKNKKKELLDKIQPGDVLTGSVSRLSDFGVFVDLGVLMV
jgi:small subunit ribosomal protein S1